MTHNTVRRAIYAGSFDPPTNGHLWMIATAQALFDELIIAVGVNPDKNCTYSDQERIDMLQAICAQFDNVRVQKLHRQFLVQFADSVQAEYIVRGIRTASDYEYERSMRYINSDLQPAISTIFLMPPREYAEVSSTMVKGLVGPANWRNVIRRYVPEPVYQKILNDYLQEHADE